MHSLATLIWQNVHKIRINPDTQKKARTSERRVQTSRQDRSGLSQMKLRTGLFYCL